MPVCIVKTTVCGAIDGVRVIRALLSNALVRKAKVPLATQYDMFYDRNI